MCQYSREPSGRVIHTCGFERVGGQVLNHARAAAEIIPCRQDIQSVLDFPTHSPQTQVMYVESAVSDFAPESTNQPRQACRVTRRQRFQPAKLGI